MTDRHAGYLITLDRDIREDDADHIINALRMVRGVLAVEPVVSGLVEQRIAEQRVDAHWRRRLYAVLAEGRSDSEGGTR